MNTLDLNNILYDNPVTKRFFLGTYPACIVPETNRKFYTFITNTDNHTKSGEHWNAWVVDNDNVTFFDSYGRNPYLLNYHSVLNNFRQIRYTSECIQDFSSQACGLFCIHFLYNMTLKLPISEFFCDYTNNLHYNDRVVLSIVDSI